MGNINIASRISYYTFQHIYQYYERHNNCRRDLLWIISARVRLLVVIFIEKTNISDRAFNVYFGDGNVLVSLGVVSTFEV